MGADTSPVYFQLLLVAEFTFLFFEQNHERNPQNVNRWKRLLFSSWPTDHGDQGSPGTLASTEECLRFRHELSNETFPMWNLGFCHCEKLLLHPHAEF